MPEERGLYPTWGDRAARRTGCSDGRGNHRLIRGDLRHPGRLAVARRGLEPGPDHRGGHRARGHHPDPDGPRQ